MAIPVIQLDNQTDSPIVLVQLGVTVPASGSIAITGQDGNVYVSEVRDDRELYAEVDAGHITLTVDGVALTTEQSKAYLNPAAPKREVKVNVATSDPTVDDDDTAGYIEGSHWINTSARKDWVLVDPGTGAAVWRNVSNPSYHNVVTVGISGSDVDFTTIKDAVDYVVAQGASGSNPWFVWVTPGSYVEVNPITVPAGVLVSSFHPTQVPDVMVSPVTATDYLFVLSGGSLFGLHMSGVTDATRACVTVTAQSEIGICSFSNCSVGLLVGSGVPCLAANLTISIVAPGVPITNAAVKVDGGLLLSENMVIQVPPDILPAYSVNPVQVGLRVENGGAVTQTGGAYAIAAKDTTQVSVQADSGSRVALTSIVFKDSETAVQVGAGGSGTVVHCSGSSFRDNTVNFDVLSSTAKVFVGVSVDSIKRSVVAGATFSGFVQEDEVDSTTFLGGVLYEYPSGKEANFGLFFHDQQSSGLVSGGVVTDAGGLTVDVSAGTGWIQRNLSNDDAFNVSWDAASGMSLTASATNYVFYNGNTDALVVSTSPPGDESIGLAAVVTDGSGIRYNHLYTNRVDSPDYRLHEYLVSTQKIRHRSGLATSVGTTNRNVDVGSGMYYRALTTISYAGAADATFSYFYGTNGANEISGQTLVDITQYDDSGTLTAMTAGYFRSDTVILTSDGRVNVIYGTEEFDIQTGAEETATVPTTPTFMGHSGFRIARLIVEQGNGIVSVVDERTPTGTGAGGTGITVHGLLSGLDADDHQQYLLVDGSRAMSGSLDVGGSSVTNVNLVDGVDVSNHSSRHDPGGVDALTTAAPSAGAVQVGNTAAEGSAASYARSDHVHTVTPGNPVAITDSTSAQGTASTFSRSDHQHAHGNRGGGFLHALVTTSVAGFMSAADKTKLDGMTGNSASHGSTFVSGDASTSSITFVDGLAGSTVSPPVSGTYVVLLNANAVSSTGSTEMAFGISKNSLTDCISDSIRRAQGNGGDNIPISTHTVLTGLVTGDLIRVLFRVSDGSGSVILRDRRVTMMRVS